MRTLFRHSPLAVWALAFGTWLISLSLSAEELPVRKVGVAVSEQRLTVTFSHRDSFTSAVRKKLTSGLTTSVIVELSLERQGSKKLATYWARTVEITYDLWEDKFIVVREDSAERRRTVVSDKGKAVDLAGVLSKVPIASLKGLPLGIYRIRAKIETNPVSKEMVTKIRRWLARSRAAQTGVSGPANYFGSFVGALVDRRISQADHTIEFVSQWFRLGDP